jgi:hypothetical protein
VAKGDSVSVETAQYPYSLEATRVGGFVELTVRNDDGGSWFVLTEFNRSRRVLRTKRVRNEFVVAWEKVTRFGS